MERTVVNFSSEFDKISPSDSILLIGSCFSANIGEALKKHKFDSISNPFGVLFHPFSIYALLKRAMEERPFLKDDFFERDEYWFSFELGANTGKSSLEEAIVWSNIQLFLLQKYLKNSSRLILTFGTAFGFSREGKIVGNCHKVSKDHFTKEMTSADDLLGESISIIDQLSKYNPNLKIHITVSPVRHIKEGLRENNLSKGMLLLLTKKIELNFTHVEYIPTYEFVIDELRDYAFFNVDLIHVNDRAIAMIWERVTSWLMNEGSLDHIKQVSKILKQLNHKTLYPKSNSNVKFKKELIKQMKRNNNIWESEIQLIEVFLINL